MDAPTQEDHKRRVRALADSNLELFRSQPPKVEMVPVRQIKVGDGRRPVQSEDVDRLAYSIAKIGLLSPICVRKSINPSGTFLIYGAHRLAAAKKLGWFDIPCFVHQNLPGDPIRDRMEEIAENLHRAELNDIERSDLIAEWIRITGEKPPTEIAILAQPAPQNS
jgi:ParB/RepB/Spo0J family partition protein